MDDRNRITITLGNGEEATIEILLGFDVVNYNKHYVAFTLNDDDQSENVNVILAEYADGQVRSILPDEREEVVAAYEEAKKLLDNIN